MRLIAKMVALAGCLSGLLFPTASSAATSVTINEGTTYQTIEGFGAYYTLNSTRTTAQIAAFNKSLITDLGLSILRSDIDETFENDLNDFVVTSNMNSHFYRLKQVIDTGSHYGVKVKVIMSCWTPPWFMKYNDLEAGNPTAANDNNSLIPSDIPALANFFVQYMKACINHKTSPFVPYALSPQNEPFFDEPYRSCCYASAGDYKSMFKVVAQALRDSGLTVKTYMPEHMGTLTGIGGFTGSTWSAILGDNSTVGLADICAVHSYLDGIQPATGTADGWSQLIGAVSPYKKELWMTETSGYLGAWADGTNPADGTAAPGAFSLAKDIFVALKSGEISSWVWWGLDEASTTDASGNPTGENTMDLVVDKNFTNKYYVSKNFYRFIRPGAKMVDCSSSDAGNLWAAAFIQPTDNTLTVVCLNNSTSAQTVNLSVTGSINPTQMDIYTTTVTSHCAIGTAKVGQTGITVPAQGLVTLYSGPSTMTPVGSAVQRQEFHGSNLSLSSGLTKITIYSPNGKVIARLTGTPGSAIAKWKAQQHHSDQVVLSSYLYTVKTSEGIIERGKLSDFN